MSLSVDVFVVDADGGMDVLDVPAGSSDAAGPESWRTKVWGSEVVRLLGARFFPALAGGDLRVEPGEVPAFLRECALLRAHMEDIVAATIATRTVEEHRYRIAKGLADIEDAARRAQRVDGGVLIW
jgi:hypothetical protein